MSWFGQVSHETQDSIPEHNRNLQAINVVVENMLKKDSPIW